MFKLIILCVAAVTIALPFVSPLIAKRMNIRTFPAHPLLPICAAILFVVSFYVPDIHISAATDTFQQHLIGGGMYSALLYLYFKSLLGWRLHWLADLVVLFAWVSALGVANKLLEFGLAETHLLALDMSDAYWDLLANTIGAFIIWAGYVAIILLRPSQSRD